MSLGTAEEETKEEIHIPADINWEMLDKSKFFLLGAGLFSGVSATLYPVVVLKTRQQVGPNPIRSSSLRTAMSIVRNEGFRTLYRGFGTSLMGTIPARAVYMTALEVTKSSVGSTTLGLGFAEPTAAAIANATAGVSAAVAAQLVWTPVDVVTQRLMVQETGESYLGKKKKNIRYANGIDGFRQIIKSNGMRGLYRGFGISILTYAPSNAVWWTSYSVAQRFIWDLFGTHVCNSQKPDSKTVVVVQGVSAALAGGASALITMPLDTLRLGCKCWIVTIMVEVEARLWPKPSVIWSGKVVGLLAIVGLGRDGPPCQCQPPL
ncbi:Solute carrier family 25 member 44 [Bienertia sinuspersici]